MLLGMVQDHADRPLADFPRKPAGSCRDPILSARGPPGKPERFTKPMLLGLRRTEKIGLERGVRPCVAFGLPPHRSDTKGPSELKILQNIRLNSAMRLLACLALAALPGVSQGQGQGSWPLLFTTSELHPTYSVYHDPDGDVSVKEFAFFRNVVLHPDTTVTPDGMVIVLRPRDLFHLIYQRSGGLHIAETTFGHAWSVDLLHWVVDTLAFATDTTWWNRHHVWSPSLIEVNGRTFM